MTRAPALSRSLPLVLFAAVAQADVPPEPAGPPLVPGSVLDDPALVGETGLQPPARARRPGGPGPAARRRPLRAPPLRPLPRRGAGGGAEHPGRALRARAAQEPAPPPSLRRHRHAAGPAARPDLAEPAGGDA